jgi:hypothetical protein
LAHAHRVYSLPRFLAALLRGGGALDFHPQITQIT